MQLAVSDSDNVACDMLLRLLGGPAAVNAYVSSLGIRDVHIANTELEMSRDTGTQYRNYASARAMVDLLRQLADHSPLNAQHTALLLQWMTETSTGPHRLKALLPAGTVIAHKTGTSGVDGGLAHATNDVGLITMKDGRKLAVAVLVSDSRAPEAVREGVIAQIGKVVWSAAEGATSPRPLQR
jgi:beta-lactamase class A